MKNWIHLPTFFASLAIAVLLGTLLSATIGMSVWVAIAIVVIATLINGAVAAFEGIRRGNKDEHGDD